MGRRSSGTLGFDAKALALEPTEGDLEQFRTAIELHGPLPAAAATRRLLVDTIVRIVLSVALLIPAILFATLPFDPDFPGAMGFAGLIGFVVMGALAAPAIWLLLRRIRRRWRTVRPWAHWYRLSRFASDNGLRFIAEMEEPRHGGLMFHQGKYRRVVDLVLTPDFSFEIGTFTFVSTSSTKNPEPRFSYLRMTLPRRVPHLVLLSVARRGFQGYSAVGLAFAESQRVSLEGDFDRTFSTYAPDGYGVDARYVLTPDFMAILVDNAAAFDVEFIDDHMYVYSSSAWDLERFATWAWAFRFAETVGTRALRRTRMFSDDRSSAPGFAVAPQGRRLKVGVPLVAGLITAGVIGFQVLRLVLNLAH
ncbi:MAG: hypothetical protein ABI435_03475 [Pseudolysinimonas sp.]